MDACAENDEELANEIGDVLLKCQNLSLVHGYFQK